jgi:hypothetical protein
MEFVFWAWGRFLALAVGTALAIELIVGVIEGHPPDSALADWLRHVVGDGS